MTNRVLLNNVDHADLRVIDGHGPAFGDAVNQALILPTEFEAAQRDYPILLRQEPSGAFQAVVLLGFDRDENLFLDGDAWRARYIPAVQRRGPFSIALRGGGGEPGEPMIHIDLDDPRVGRAEGEPLFLPAGGNAPHLLEVARVLGDIYQGLDIQRDIYDAFLALNLIEPLPLEIEVGDGKRYELPGFNTISVERLTALRGGDLERMHTSGLLRAAQWIVSSLGNLEQLIALKAARA